MFYGSETFFYFGFDMNKNLITSNFLYEQKFNNIIMKTLHEQFIITKTLHEQLNLLFMNN